MVWFRVDDQFAGGKKVERLQAACSESVYLAAIAVWTLLGSDCGLRLSDGVFSRARAAKVASCSPRTLAAALAALVDAELIEPHPEGWVFHDWPVYNRTKAQVLAEREATKQRVKRHRNAQGNAVGNGVTEDPGLARPQCARSAPAARPQRARSAPAREGDSGSPTKPADSDSGNGVTNALPDPTRPDLEEKKTPLPSVGVAGSSSSGAAKRKVQTSLPTIDPTPAEGSVARRVYDAIVTDSILGPITDGPGDFASRITAEGTFPGVDVLAQVRLAGIHAAGAREPYRDGRRFLTGWLKRSAADVARAPRPAPQAARGGIRPPAPDSAFEKATKAGHAIARDPFKE